MKPTEKFLTLILATIALVVAVGLYHGQNMWLWILAYWVVLSIDNFREWFRR